MHRFVVKLNLPLACVGLVYSEQVISWFPIVSDPFSFNHDAFKGGDP